MNWKTNPLLIIGLVAVAPIVAHAKIYVSVEQAQKILSKVSPVHFPDLVHCLDLIQYGYQDDGVVTC